MLVWEPVASHGPRFQEVISDRSRERAMRRCRFWANFRETLSTSERLDRAARIFAEEGTLPVGPDRATMDAALALAAASRAALAATVSAYDAESRAEAAAAEAAAHDEAREQWEAETTARWYRGNEAKLTVRERLTDGVRHEAMLRGSFQGLSASGRFLRRCDESCGRRRRGGGVGSGAVISIYL